ncbi:AAA family ATPase [Pectobacterium polaris]|uniref:AAA family ATPase n=1 Tax=Pectobacterium polaris TaxID=2042057 RepID=UPI0020C146A3|nr:AAA family ATPase [Pectobacterium polaris]
MNDSRDKVRVHDISEDSHNNYYTILTGDNASGKSSLLSKAINFFLFSNKNNDYIDPAVELVCLSESNPSKIIALCNSRFDRFTSNNILNKKSNNKDTTPISMNYIHPEVNGDSRRGISGIVDQCVKNSLRHKNTRDLQEANRVKEAFMMFGLQSDLHLKCTLNTQNIKYIFSMLSSLINGSMMLSDEGITDAKKKNHLKNEDLKNRNLKLDESIGIIWREKNKINLNGLCDTLLMLDAGKITPENFSDIYFSIAEGSISSERKSLFYDLNELEMINFLFILDVINVSDIQVMHLNSKKEVSIVSLSSGQRTLFGHAIVLSGFVEKNCMICIDEPENSLHPEWQLNFMRFISLLCPDTLEAHIIIATHSPQIISGMQFDNGCVLSLANRNNIDPIMIRKEKKLEENWFYELQPLKTYREQSADKQLAGIFKSPGYKNDYIIKKLLLIISKISKKVNLTKDDNEFMDEISMLIDKSRIPEGDPVQLIFKQIVSFEKARDSDD